MKVEKAELGQIPVPSDSESDLPLARVSMEDATMDDLVLDAPTKEGIGRIIAENKNLQKILEYGIRPKQKILLCGPPGTGKTLTSRILASSLKIPLVRVEFDSLISSLLGETGSNLRKIFDMAEEHRCVVMFDEFDVIGKSRDDSQEHGEMKRVISSFMQLIDTYQGTGLLVAATNHQHMLDPAVWRRFDEILMYGKPDIKRRKILLEKGLGAIGYTQKAAPSSFAAKTSGFSAADISGACLDAMRRTILSKRKAVGSDDLRWGISERRRRKEVMVTK